MRGESFGFRFFWQSSYFIFEKRYLAYGSSDIYGGHRIKKWQIDKISRQKESYDGLAYGGRRVV